MIEATRVPRFMPAMATPFSNMDNGSDQASDPTEVQNTDSVSASSSTSSSASALSLYDQLQALQWSELACK